MHSQDITTELQAFRAALERRPEPTITGGQIAAIVRMVAPDLDVRAIVGRPKGKGALSKFIETFLPDALEPMGNQGADVLYLIKGRDAPASQGHSSPEIWRTFVSPNSSRSLVLIASSGRLVSRNTHAVDSADEIEIQRATLKEHDEIRAEFMQSLSGPEVSILRDKIPETADFTSWIEALKAHVPEATGRWGQFRRQKLSELFRARVDALQLSASVRQNVLEQIKLSELSVYEAQKSGRSSTDQPHGKKQQHMATSVDATARARLVAHAAINQLTYEELRELRFPLGAMLDSLNAGS